MMWRCNLSFTFILAALVLFVSTSAFADSILQRKKMAGHPTINAQQAQRLLQDSQAEVRAVLASNRRTDKSILHQLAQDKAQMVRIAVATNLSTPAKTHMLLAEDKALSVRSVVARFEYIPAEVLAKLAADSSAEIRLEVARNLNTSVATLKRLSKDSFPDVAAIAHQSLTQRAQETESSAVD